jgi:hypothetical protein
MCIGVAIIELQHTTHSEVDVVQDVQVFTAVGIKAAQ